jgi:hypothetical protein
MVASCGVPAIKPFESAVCSAYSKQNDRNLDPKRMYMTGTNRCLKKHYPINSAGKPTPDPPTSTPPPRWFARRFFITHKILGRWIQDNARRYRGRLG